MIDSRKTSRAEISDKEIDLNPTQARGGTRNGMIWVLLISTALATIVLLGYWMLLARHLGDATHPHGQVHNSRLISTYNLSGPSPRDNPAPTSPPAQAN